MIPVRQFLNLRKGSVRNLGGEEPKERFPPTGCTPLPDFLQNPGRQMRKRHRNRRDWDISGDPERQDNWGTPHDWRLAAMLLGLSSINPTAHPFEGAFHKVG